MIQQFLASDFRVFMLLVYLLVGVMWVSILRLNNSPMAIGEMLVNLIFWPIAVLIVVLRIEL